MAQRKLSKRETIRRMYERAQVNMNRRWMSFSYVARAIGKSVDEMIYFMNWMAKHEGIYFVTRGKNIVFTFKDESKAA